eukprot:2759333-Rhodomonas_salina.1
MRAHCLEPKYSRPRVPPVLTALGLQDSLITAWDITECGRAWARWRGQGDRSSGDASRGAGRCGGGGDGAGGVEVESELQAMKLRLNRCATAALLSFPLPWFGFGFGSALALALALALASLGRVGLVLVGFASLRCVAFALVLVCFAQLCVAFALLNFAWRLPVSVSHPPCLAPITDAMSGLVMANRGEQNGRSFGSSGQGAGGGG